MVLRSFAKTSRFFKTRNGLDCRLRHLSGPEPRANQSPRHPTSALWRGADPFSGLQGADGHRRRFDRRHRFCLRALVDSCRRGRSRPGGRFRRDLDRGEAEAIALAIERRADLILVDEKRGRRIAAAAGLTVTGLLGVVARAKRTGLISPSQTCARPIDRHRPFLDRT